MFKTKDASAWFNFTNGQLEGFEGNQPTRLVVRSAALSAVYLVSEQEVTDPDTGEVETVDNSLLLGAGQGEYELSVRLAEPHTLRFVSQTEWPGAFLILEGGHTQPTLEEPEPWVKVKPRSALSQEMKLLLGVINAERNANAEALRQLRTELKEAKSNGAASVVPSPAGAGGDGAQPVVPAGEPVSRGDEPPTVAS